MSSCSRYVAGYFRQAWADRLKEHPRRTLPSQPKLCIICTDLELSYRQFTSGGHVEASNNIRMKGWSREMQVAIPAFTSLINTCRLYVKWESIVTLILYISVDYKKWKPGQIIFSERRTFWKTGKQPDFIISSNAFNSYLSQPVTHIWRTSCLSQHVSGLILNFLFGDLEKSYWRGIGFCIP